MVHVFFIEEESLFSKLQEMCRSSTFYTNKMGTFLHFGYSPGIELGSESGLHCMLLSPISHHAKCTNIHESQQKQSFVILFLYCKSINFQKTISKKFIIHKEIKCTNRNIPIICKKYFPKYYMNCILIVLFCDQQYFIQKSHLVIKFFKQLLFEIYINLFKK